MERLSMGGTTVNGEDDIQSAYEWVCFTVRPKDIFQLSYLIERLMEYSLRFPPDLDFSRKFRWAISHLRYLEHDYYRSQDSRRGDYFWSSACELSWRALKIAVLNPWDLRVAEASPYGTIEYHKSYELCYYEFHECLTQEWWIVD